jgi:hypothetical protein
VTTKAKDDRQASVSQEERNERLRTYAAARLDPVEIALDLITTVRAWNDLREGQQMSFDQASEFWRQAIDRLLPPTPAAP